LSQITSILVHGDNVISGYQNGSIEIHETQTGSFVGSMVGHETAIKGLSIQRGVNPKRSLLVSIGDDKNFKVWDLCKFECIDTVEGSACYFTVDFGDDLVATSTAGSVHIFEPMDERLNKIVTTSRM